MIYDCFTFFNELDLLELRLNVLYNYVDKFVIAEANKTHTGKDKDFIFEKNKTRFNKFLDKIIYIKVDDFPSLENSQSDKYGNKWLYENYQRDAIMRGLTECKPNDVIIISDCDEIPNPIAIRNYKSGICILRQWAFYYNLNTLNKYHPYTKGAKICRYSDLIDPKQNLGDIEFCKFSKYGLPTYLRFCKGTKIKNGGWHFSYFGSLDNIILKRQNIVEQQFNNSQNMSVEYMKKLIDNGEDILERGIKFINVNPKDILPKYVIQNSDKYTQYINNTNLKSLFVWKMLYLFSKIYSVTYKNNDINQKIFKILGIKIKIINKRKKISPEDKEKFLDYILNQQLDYSNFVEEISEQHKFNNNDVKLISFYLPQYHAIPENDKWFVKGFTEWFNVTKSVPQYLNHWQPHLPIDMGFYTLDCKNDVMEKQISLAKKYGIGGFCFYYYWFNGQKLLEKPIEYFLNNKSLDMPFCLFWDSDHWTKTWNGGSDTEIMYEQKIEDDTAQRFMQDFIKYAHDERYIKINNCPVFVISTPKTFPKDKFSEFIKQIRAIAKQEGFADLYLMSLRGNVSNEEIKTYNFDAMLEFFPCGIDDLIQVTPEKIINPKFSGAVYNVEKFIKNKKYLYNAPCKIFKSCFPNWDNTARKCYKKARIFPTTPAQYKQWLKDIIGWTKQNHSESEQFVFINAWNEWAEGAHLEPDRKYGYAFLQATKEALEENY